MGGRTATSAARLQDVHLAMGVVHSHWRSTTIDVEKCAATFVDQGQLGDEESFAVLLFWRLCPQTRCTDRLHAQ